MAEAGAIVREMPCRRVESSTGDFLALPPGVSQFMIMDYDTSPMPPTASADLSAGSAPVIPIARASLHREVAARVRDMIVDGRLAPGAAIPELDLARQLGVSRTPLREAIKVLASEGLLELLPGRGAVVKVFTAKDAQDMLTLIALLEEHAGPRACAASDAEIAAILEMHAQMRIHYERRETGRILPPQSGNPRRNRAGGRQSNAHALARHPAQTHAAHPLQSAIRGPRTGPRQWSSTTASSMRCARATARVSVA